MPCRPRLTAAGRPGSVPPAGARPASDAMCLAAFALNAHPRFPLVIANQRLRIDGKPYVLILDRLKKK